MSYSPVCKSKKNKSNNESLLEDIRNSIDKEYREAVQSDDWSNYNFVYEMYYNYKLNGGNNEYVENIVKRYQSQYIEKIQRDCISSMVNIALNDTIETETIHTVRAGKKLVEFNRQVYNTNMSPIAEVIKGTELDCCNTIETKPKTFVEMSYEEKIKFVNKEIDDLLDFIERNKRVKYNKWRKEIGI